MGAGHKDKWWFLGTCQNFREKRTNIHIWDVKPEVCFSVCVCVCRTFSLCAGDNRSAEMAIAHVATEYVFSDFLLKEPNQARYRSVRTELAVDKMVTCVAVGLPLLLISLAFAQEVSVGKCGWYGASSKTGSWLVQVQNRRLFLTDYNPVSGSSVACCSGIRED